jgi:hypothetical protein
VGKNMIWINKILIVLCLFLISARSQAQNIVGHVEDDTRAPIEFANIVLLSQKDSTYITGTVSDSAGKFTLPSGKNGVLHITCMGYRPLYVQSREVLKGAIVMYPSENALSEVVVKGSRPLVRMKDDALVTSVQGTYLAKVGTAYDLLDQIPGVVKNTDGIEVIGKGTPLIYINGRLMRNLSELDQLASSQVQDVEVIGTPGAKYDATANAIIRIKTVKPAGEGLAVDSRTMAGLKRYLYGIEELNLNYRKNGLDVFGMVEYDKDKERQTITTTQDVYTSNYLFHQNNIDNRSQRNQVYTTKIGANFTFNEHHSLGAIYDFSYKPVKVSDKAFTEMLKDNVLADNVNDENLSNNRNNRHLLSGYYTGQLKDWSVNLNTDALWTNEHRTQRISETASADTVRAFATGNRVSSKLYAAKLEVGHPLWKGDISFGSEWSFIRRSDVYDSSASYIANSDTKQKEDNKAGFVELTQHWGKIMASLGLRYEHTSSRYYSQGKKQEEQCRTYNNIFPSAMLLMPIGNTRIRLSYSKKVTRPAFSQLSSNVQYINRYTYQSGNPNLQPSFRDYVEFTASYKWFTLMSDYTHTSGYIMSVYTQYLNNPEISLLQKQNAKSFNELSTMVNVAPSFGIYHPSLMAAINKQFFNITFLGKPTNMDKPIGVFRFNNAINTPFDSWLNVDMSWRTNGHTENMYLHGSWQLNLGFYKSFNKDRWSIKVQCNDICKTAKSQVTLTNDIRQIHLTKNIDTRNFSVTIRYRFNATESKYKGTGAAEEDKNRL